MSTLSTPSRLRRNVAGRRAMRGGTLALLYLVGSSLGILWTFVSDAPQHRVLIWVLVGGICALAPAYALGYRRLPTGAFAVIVGLSNLLVSGALYASADQSSPYVLFYLWATPYSFAFFKRGHAIAQVVLVAVSYAAVLAALPSARASVLGIGPEEAVRWATVVVTVVMSSVLIDRLTTALSASSERLRERARQQAAVAELGRRALAGMGLEELIDAALTELRDTLEVEFTTVLERRDDHLQIIAGVGRNIDRSARVPLRASSIATYALSHRQPVVCEDLHDDDRFEGSPALHRHGIKSGLAVLIEVAGRPFGVLSGLSTTSRRFSDDDVNFLQSVANIIAAAVARTRSEERTRHQALHDPLTGLPNRTLFVDRLTTALVRARRHGSLLAVLFVDVDQFKVINDSLGHQAGDRVLTEVAPRLREALRTEDTVARFGGDEFVLLCEDVDSEAEALEIAERTLAVFDRPFTLAGAAHRVTASIGVAIAWGREAPDAVLRDADSAMYRAKDRGRARFELFDEDMRARALDRLATEVALNGAAERGELRLFYQPVVKAGTGEVVAAEALLRWERPGHGLVAPSDFIPVAEQSGQILELGEWVLRTACAEVVRWNREDLGRGRELGVTVNLSARQLSQPGLVEMVARTMEETGLTVPWMLGLEITESVLMEDIDAAAETLTRLGELGVMLVLDDFGAGYSSLAYVKRLPLDVLKLDRSFSDGLTDGGKDVAIVAAVSAMAQAIGVRVVAEGIETAAQAERANELGCGYAQGYWYARPMAPEALSQVLGRPLPLAAARA